MVGWKLSYMCSWTFWHITRNSTLETLCTLFFFFFSVTHGCHEMDLVKNSTSANLQFFEAHSQLVSLWWHTVMWNWSLKLCPIIDYLVFIFSFVYMCVCFFINLLTNILFHLTHFSYIVSVVNIKYNNHHPPILPDISNFIFFWFYT